MWLLIRWSIIGILFGIFGLIGILMMGEHYSERPEPVQPKDDDNF